MKISQLITYLESAIDLKFYLPTEELIAPHFHITECGVSTKHFMDCGGKERTETNIVFQLWINDDDAAHRLTPDKLLGIIKSSEKMWGDLDPEVELEYQGSTIYKYGLKSSNSNLILVNKKTACLAEEFCGVSSKIKVNLADLAATTSCCTPGSGCC